MGEFFSDIIQFFYSLLLIHDQVLILLMGCTNVLIGAGFLGYDLYWRFNARVVKGVVKAVRVGFKRKDPVKVGKRLSYPGEVYYPVVEYYSSDNEKTEHVLTSGLAHLSDILPGKNVRLLALSGKKEKVRMSTFLFLFFGLCFLLSGLFVLYDVFSFKLMIAGLLFCGFGVLWIIRGNVKEAFRALKGRHNSDEPIVNVSDPGLEERMANTEILEQAEFLPRIKAYAHEAVIAGGICLFLSLAFFWTAYDLGQKMIILYESPQYTQGTVIGVNSRRHSGDLFYYTQVSFSDVNGREVHFEDDVGYNKPYSYKDGDVVDVLYNPERPGDAVINRGLINWGISAVVAFIAAIVFLLGATLIKRSFIVWIVSKSFRV